MEMKTKMADPIRIAIIGLGLLGTSLGMALRGRTQYLRSGWTRKKEVREWALANQVLDETEDSLESVLGKADLTVLALPIPQIVEFLERYAHCWRKGSVVTDMGSVKSVILQAAERALPPHGVRFVGSHPMAGTEKSGHLAAFETLYGNADVFVCPSGACSDEESVRLVEDFWRSIGTKPVLLESAEEHDRLVAHTSHVLHVVASALALGILEGSSAREQALRFAGCATGFRDTSRIASSNPAMWREIIEHNTPAVLEALDTFLKELDSLRGRIASGDYDGFEDSFARGKTLRDQWLEYKARKP